MEAATPAHSLTIFRPRNLTQQPVECGAECSGVPTAGVPGTSAVSVGSLCGMSLRFHNVSIADATLTCFSLLCPKGYVKQTTEGNYKKVSIYAVFLRSYVKP